MRCFVRVECPLLGEAFTTLQTDKWFDFIVNESEEEIYDI